jgi:hypothetical protein
LAQLPDDRQHDSVCEATDCVGAWFLAPSHGDCQSVIIRIGRWTKDSLLTSNRHSVNFNFAHRLTSKQYAFTYAMR